MKAAVLFISILTSHKRITPSTKWNGASLRLASILEERANGARFLLRDPRYRCAAFLCTEISLSLRRIMARRQGVS